MSTAPFLLEVEHLEQRFPIRGGLLVSRKLGEVHAVDDVSLALREGETLGIVGESGCGKTTLARCLVRLLRPSGGRISFRGRDITTAGRRDLRPLRSELQMVFQDPHASLNPRKRVGQIVGSPLKLRGVRRPEADARVHELLERVGLDPGHVNRFPHEFSGGQRQRVGIARALAMEPKLIILDEPVSALDVSIQAQVINLLDDLQEDFGLSYLFVAHDLSVVRHVSDRIAVMYLGKVMESSPAEELYVKPIHPYTEALLAAIPKLDAPPHTTLPAIAGRPPDPTRPLPGCSFAPRCPMAFARCRVEAPRLREAAPGHQFACHLEG
jgi:oligopeptide/dipeptide ABC transporter ATP-binding protein